MLLSDTLFPTFPVETFLSVFSAAMTAWFWLVKVRNERPNLRIFQLADFRVALRRREGQESTRTLSLTQVEPGGVLIANNSSRQNSIIRFDCYLQYQGELVQGRWGYLSDDKPPWNIPPESTVAVSPACFFDVPADCQPPETLTFRVEFISVTGQRFPHLFQLKSPER